MLSRELLVLSVDSVQVRYEQAEPSEFSLEVLPSFEPRSYLLQKQRLPGKTLGREC